MITPPCITIRRPWGEIASENTLIVGESGENLQAFLAGRRERTDRCTECIYAIACPGEYVFDDDANREPVK